MKWIKKDCYGNEQVWYSGDVIEEIKSICNQNGLIEHRNKNGVLIAQEGNPITAKILRVIESGE